MSDKILVPADVSFTNPIWYRDKWRIYPGNTVFAAWVFSHDDFDGAPDSGDGRCGYGDAIEDCKRDIDEMCDG